MSRHAQVCRHWIGAEHRHWIGAEHRHCLTPDARPYLTGYRCPDHTPAALAGVPEAPSIPMHTPEGTSIMASTARLGNSESKLGWLIGTRGRGGYVVAAGSTVAGRPYTIGYDTTSTVLPSWPLQQLLTTPVRARAAIPVPATSDRRTPTSTR